MRPRYLAAHVHHVWKAVNIGTPIRGYFHWSLVDNFEWEHGWSQRFGLWGLDTETQAGAIAGQASTLYAEICTDERAVLRDGRPLHAGGARESCSRPPAGGSGHSA